MKKKPLFYLALVCLAGLVFQSCSDDDETPQVDSTPEFSSLVSAVSTLPGETFTFEGTVTDPAGIQSVNIRYEPWFLDKTISKDSLPVSYDLAYSFMVPADSEMESSHTVPVTVTNAGGITTTQEITIILDRDAIAPELNIAGPTDGSTVLIGDDIEINLDFSVTDEELAELKIESDLLNETLEIEGTSSDYSQEIDVENTGEYTFTITATDASGNATSQSIVVNVIEELMFETMFFTDVAVDSVLTSDVFGVPYITEASSEADETGFVFNARYYAAEANAELRFIPQKTSFAPFSFGVDPDTEGSLLIGSGADVAPIVLADAGYYEINMDLRDLTYTVTPYTPEDETFDFVQLISRGATVNGESTCISNVDGSTRCFHFTSGKPLVQDPANPYRFTAEVELFDEPDDEGVNQFIINANPAGWAPFWRFEEGAEPNATVPGGGSNFIFTEEAFGTYTFTFDTHLNRVTIVPVN